MTAGRDTDAWHQVDEGWGRVAADFATLVEPSACREYVAVHHRLGVDGGDRLLDVACGSGLAVELAGLRGAVCAGIDASARLVAIARDRSRSAGATSRPHPARGRSARSGWPTRPSSRTRRRWSRSAARGPASACSPRPASSTSSGSRWPSRGSSPTRRRTGGLAATGPAYEAIRAVGEQAFHEAVLGVAAEQVRAGLPLRAEIAVTGYLARRPGDATAG